jgi:hypothetical protein
MKSSHISVLSLWISIILLSCVQDASLNTKVQYSLIVQDSKSKAPVSKAQVFVKTSELDYDTLQTDLNGRAETPIYNAQSVQIIVQRDSFMIWDTLDILKLDSTNTSDAPVLKLLKVALQRESQSSSSSLLSSSSSYFSSSNQSSSLQGLDTSDLSAWLSLRSKR